MNDSLVLLPTYNERENVSQILPRLEALKTVDVLVIDDSSPDGTARVAERMRSRFAGLSVLVRKHKEGLGRAYAHGFQVAIDHGYERIVTMDADLSHTPEDVPRLLDALTSSDVAVGSRHVDGGGVVGWPYSRQLLSRCGSFYARSLLNLPVRDVTSGFRAYRRKALETVDWDFLHACGFVFQIEILRRILDAPGATAAEIPILFRNRVEGRSKLTNGVITEATFEVLRLARRAWRSRSTNERQPPRQGRRLPTVSVVVPCRPDVKTPVGPTPERLHGAAEIVLARGTSPAKQRNEAVARASGDLLLFLDDDSEPDPQLADRYARFFRDHPDVAAVGGPSVGAGTTLAARTASALFGDQLVVGRTAARYRALGVTRDTDERELILCNLCVRREAFDAAGGFDERLFPNEENEFLLRLKRTGQRLIYNPAFHVQRSHRSSIGELLKSVFGYGRGRGRQLRVRGSGVSLARCALAVCAIVGAVGSIANALTGGVFGLCAVSFYALYALLIGTRATVRHGVAPAALAVALVGPFHLAYAFGVVIGIARAPNRLQGSVEVDVQPLERGGRS